jgi:hypothetical protein
MTEETEIESPQLMRPAKKQKLGGKQQQVHYGHQQSTRRALFFCVCQGEGSQQTLRVLLTIRVDIYISLHLFACVFARACVCADACRIGGNSSFFVLSKESFKCLQKFLRKREKKCVSLLVFFSAREDHLCSPHLADARPPASTLSSSYSLET